RVGRGDAFVAGREVEPFRGTKLCAVNKMDLLKRHEVVPQLATAAGLASFDHVIPTSAVSRAGLEELHGALVGTLPAGEPLFPEDLVTDLPLELQVAEIVREKALALTREEVPHSIAVEVQEMSVPGASVPGVTRISCVVAVERESQKGILIGKGGSMLKEI